jgi:hypothetical protein
MNFILGFLCVIIFTALCTTIYVFNDNNEDNEIH